MRDPRFVEIDEAAAYFFMGGGLGPARCQALDHRQFFESRAELAARGFGQLVLFRLLGTLLFQRIFFGAAVQMRLVQQLGHHRNALRDFRHGPFVQLGEPPLRGIGALAALVELGLGGHVLGARLFDAHLAQAIQEFEALLPAVAHDAAAVMRGSLGLASCTSAGQQALETFAGHGARFGFVGPLCEELLEGGHQQDCAVDRRRGAGAIGADFDEIA